MFRLTISLLIHHLSFFFLSYFNHLAQIKGGGKDFSTQSKMNSNYIEQRFQKVMINSQSYDLFLQHAVSSLL